ncbi:MAG TPA: TlpA disulfide reductase family protein [Pirellulales bacterium]|nr:TlpA disulfide reductase family protein [Pirellulales bacterium]
MDSEPVSSPHSATRFWIFLAAGAGLVLLLISLLRTQAGGGSGRSHPAVGKRLPPVRLTPLTFDGEPVTSAELEGRVAVINFWGTWCPPCRAELPHVAELGQRYAGDDRFRLLAVSCGGGPPSEDEPGDLRGPTAALLDQQGLSLAAYADRAGQTRDRLAEAGLFEHSYPTTLVVDPQGMVRGVWVGYGPGDERHVEALVAELLAK